MYDVKRKSKQVGNAYIAGGAITSHHTNIAKYWQNLIHHFSKAGFDVFADLLHDEVK